MAKFEKIVPNDFFDSGDLKILICYMLDSIKEPVPATETAQLFHYEGISNYFDTQTAIYDLEKNGYIVQSGKKDMFTVTQKGADLSNTLKENISSTLRTKVYNAVVKMLTRYKAERDTDIQIEQKPGGYLLTYKVSAGTETLVSFSIMLPNMSQATALKEQILKDPKYYCDSFINLLTEDLNFDEKV